MGSRSRIDVISISKFAINSTYSVESGCIVRTNYVASSRFEHFKLASYLHVSTSRKEAVFFLILYT